MNEQSASPVSSDDRVSRRRYEREISAREQAEKLLEQKSRELLLANEALNKHLRELNQIVDERTHELREALERAQQEAIAKARFFATMNHEIRTPLGGLLGVIDLLSLDEEDPEKL